MATRSPVKKTTSAKRKADVLAKSTACNVKARVPAAPARTVGKAAKFSDYEGARQLLSRYCALIDRGKLVELSDLFHREAKFSVSFDTEPSHTGRAAVLAWYTRFFSERPSRVGYPRHKIFEPYLVANGDTVTASTYFDSDFVEVSGRVRVLAGRYDDVLVKERGQWFFKERTITICYHYSPGKGTHGMAP